MWWMTVTLALAGRIELSEPLPVVGGSGVVLLGLSTDQKYAAFRNYGGSGAFKCAYAGRPHGGSVELGLYDFEEGRKVASWWIYDPAEHLGECTPHAISVHRLEQAKGVFSALGIDVSTPIPKVTLAELGLTEAPPSDPQPGDIMHAEHALWRGDQELYVGRVDAGNSVKVSFPAAWRVGERALVLDCTTITSIRGTSTWCGFVPWLPVGAAP